jgi:hypothetical protein
MDDMISHETTFPDVDLPFTELFGKSKAEFSEAGKKAMEAQPEMPKIVPRYVSLKLKQPRPLSHDVLRIGMWVKGNSCWGRVYWEFTDAKGERYFSASDETSGWDVSDWKGRTAIHFDGWRFVSLDLPRKHSRREVKTRKDNLQ